MSVWIEAYGEARLILDSVVEAARQASALSRLPLALAMRSELDFRTGRWASAYADASESVRLATDTQQLAHSPFCRVCLARVEAGQGREEDCRANALGALERAEALGIGSVMTYGFSALGLGRPAEAIRHLEQVVLRVEEHGLPEPAVIQWGRTSLRPTPSPAAATRPETAWPGSSARRSGRLGPGRWPRRPAAAVFLAADQDFEGSFEEALRRHEGSPTPFERARTELRYGGRLRRARRLTEARGPLASALETFERLGATPWAQQARAELAAAGAREPGRRAQGAHALAPQELQVALLVAEGAPPTGRPPPRSSSAPRRWSSTWARSSTSSACVRGRSWLVSSSARGRLAGARLPRRGQPPPRWPRRGQGALARRSPCRRRPGWSTAFPAHEPEASGTGVYPEPSRA